MSQWTERIKTHTVWNELNLLGPAIDRATEREGNDVAVIDGLERLRAVLNFCGKRLAATDPFLAEPRPLATLNSALSSARAEIEAFTSDGNVTHIINANVKADDVLASLPAILAPNSSDELTVISESVSSYRVTLERYLQEALATQLALKAKSDANGTKLAEIEKILAAEQQRLATLVSGYQTQFLTAQDQRASEFASAQADRQTKTAASMSEFQTAFTNDQAERQKKYVASMAENQTLFSAAQDTRSNGYAETQRDTQDKFAALITAYTQALNEQNNKLTEQHDTAANSYQANLIVLKTDYEQSGKKILDEINGYKKQVEKLVGVIGNLGVTSGYQKVANHARWALYIWQALTILALGGLIYIAFSMAFTQPTHPAIPQITSQATPQAASQVAAQATSTVVSDSVFYQGLATRVFLSLTFGILAAYAAKQAAKFFDIEQRNRKLALELEALGPYIAPLPLDMQHKFRADLGERSFGIPDGDLNKQKEADPVTVLDILKSKEAGEILSNILKTKKSAEEKL